MDFHTRLTANARRITNLVASGGYRPSPPTRLLMEKSKGLCRQIVLPTVDDALVLQRLSDSFFDAIRGKSPSSSAYFEPDNFSFVSRDSGNQGYGSFAAWLHFQRKVRDLCSDNEYIVITDIANYYDHIGYNSLRNVISSTVQVSETILDILIVSLGGMVWKPDYMPHVDMGLPQIDLDAPRILAHTFLFDLDRYAAATTPGRFTRYMDDINFGVPTIAAAKKIIRDVDLVLHTRQVRLNSGKTMILPSSEARRYFRIEDHEEIDRFEDGIKYERLFSIPLAPRQAAAESKIFKKHGDGDFESGQGEKVLKRLFSISRKLGSTVHSDIIKECLRDRPGCRSAALDYLAFKGTKRNNLKIVTDFARSDETIDDVSVLLSASTLVDMKARSRLVVRREVMPLISHLGEGGMPQIYAALWLLSKFGIPEEIMRLIQRRSADWTTDPALGRMVGGLYPRLFRTPEFEVYSRAIQESGSLAAASTYRFHSQLINSNTVAGAVAQFVAAPNTSRPLKINHPKFLILLSILHNENLTDRFKLNLIFKHRTAWSDAFYRSITTSALPNALRSNVL